MITIFKSQSAQKPVLHYCAQGSDYRWSDSWLDWALYGTCLVFVWPGELGNQPTDWQWQCGAISVCLAWLNIILFLRRQAKFNSHSAFQTFCLSAVILSRVRDSSFLDAFFCQAWPELALHRPDMKSGEVLL